MLTIIFFIFLSHHRISFISPHLLLSFIPLYLYISYHYSLPSFFLQFQNIMLEKCTFIDRHNHLSFLPLPLRMMLCLILDSWECSCEHSSLSCYLHDVASQYSWDEPKGLSWTVCFEFVRSLLWFPASNSSTPHWTILGSHSNLRRTYWGLPKSSFD